MTAVALRLIHSSIGRKYLMAVSGMGWFVFLILHLYSNLQVFAGPDATNAYYAGLKTNPVQLWGVRVVLFAGFAVHVALAFAIMLTWARARRDGYARFDAGPASYPARTMAWTGPIVGAYILFHLAHLSVGLNGSFVHGDVYGNIVRGLREWYVAGFYLLSVFAICMHMLHGFSSALRSLGFDDVNRPFMFRVAAAAIPITVFIGFASIPLAVVTGYLKA